MTTPSARLRAAIRTASQGLVAREALVELVVLAAVAREHLLVIGPPGTAKSEAVRRASRALGARRFEYLLGRFSEPSELFGTVDLQALQAGRVVTDTTGMLPEAEIAFLDEVFLGSTAILNTLLGILAERRFRRGHTDLVCPLRVCVGASNALPDDVELQAFADRFVLRVFTEPLPDPRLEELLEAGWTRSSSDGPTATVEDVDALAETARAMDLSSVRPALAKAVRILRSRGVELSDRRAVKLQTLVAAAAALADRPAPTLADLWPVVYAVPTEEGQEVAREALEALLVEAESPALVAAALEASRSPAARARAVAEAAEMVLSAPTDDAEGQQLRLEGVLRDMDAAFDPDDPAHGLREVRTRLMAALDAS